MDAPNILIAAAYPQLKAQYPNEGRRRWKLRAVEELWRLSSAAEIETKSQELKTAQEVQPLPWLTDKDPLDLDDGEGGVVNARGVIVRTDFSDDAAWETFLGHVKVAEREGFEGMMAGGPDEKKEEDEEDQDDSESSDEEDQDEDGAQQQMDVDQGSSSTAVPQVPSIFHIVDPPPSDPLRSSLQDASNIRLLRLFNDVQVVPAPPKPRPPPGDLFSGMPKKKPQQQQVPAAAAAATGGENNRLVDKFGWKEVYPGRILWVFDGESAGKKDGSVRVVNSGDDSAYGSSTGDSWRVRAAHIWELQVNMDSGALKIDFGGGDGRWTGKERMRNYDEVGDGQVDAK
ncbi:hypothetical protein FRB90_007421 [Tulasnella sp. 427]|nr:hypothetical protein FRB90_007421 [Tulasnella sp. 427]